MPSEKKTDFAKLNDWKGNEYPKREDFCEDNIKIDSLLKSLSDKINSVLTKEQTDLLYAALSHRHDVSDINDLTSTITATKVNNSANAELLDNLESTDFMRSYMGNGVLANDLGVAKELRWKHYGQGHTIFDASNGTTPSGRTCDRSNPERAWHEANCPTLMAWNGHQTYGVRVANSAWADNSHNSNSIQGFQFRNNGGTLEVYLNGEWKSVGGKQYTVVRQGSVDRNRTFEYSGGAGILRLLTASPQNGDNISVTIVADNVRLSDIGLYVNSNPPSTEMGGHYRPIYCARDIEFKNSISIQLNTYGFLTYFIQTEK